MPACGDKLDHHERRRRRQAIAEFIRSGRTVHEACAGFGVSHGLVKQSCRDYGVDSDGRSAPPGGSRRKAGVFAILSRLFDPSSSFSAVALSLGVSRQRVWEVHRQAVEAGIPLPPRERP